MRIKIMMVSISAAVLMLTAIVLIIATINDYDGKDEIFDPFSNINQMTDMEREEGLLDVIDDSIVDSSHNNDLNGYGVEVYTEMEVRGNSMSGIIESGQTVVVDMDYIELHRGDIAIISYAGNDAPVIKSIFGIAGDRFELINGKLYINSAIAHNSEGIEYTFSANNERMLLLYADSYNNIIPENTYLVLGNIPSGSTDSTRFGLIDRSSIIGRVVEVR